MTAFNTDGQLFHTYSTVSTRDLGDKEFLEEVLAGSLQLSPHRSVNLGHPIEWDADPLNDDNWRFQFHCLVWVDRLRSVSISEGSDRGLHLYEELLRSWIVDNPVDSPMDDYAWFDMAVGMRAVVLLMAAKHFDNPSWLVESIKTHGNHLADPENYEGRGNHSLHQDMGLIAVAQYLERSDWTELATSRILKMLDDAIDEYGVSREGSIDYQFRNYRWYEEAFERMKAARVEPPREKTKLLLKMTEFMAHATSPSGFYAMLGDTVYHKAPRIKGTPADWTRDVKLAPKEKTKIYDSGYVFARASWDQLEKHSNSYLTQRFGPGRSTAVHGHEDAGSITLDAYGERLLCDSGLYAYEAGDERLYFRGRESHNVIDVSGRKYYPSANSPLVHREVTPEFTQTTVKVQGLQGVIWYRTMAYFPNHDFILVDDRITNTLPGEIKQQWNLPRDSVLRFSEEECYESAQTPSGAVVRLRSLNSRPLTEVTKGNSNPLSGWVSDEYRQKVPTPKISYIQEGDSVRFTNLIEWSNIDNPIWASDISSRRTTKSFLISFIKAGELVEVDMESQKLTWSKHRK